MGMLQRWGRSSADPEFRAHRVDRLGREFGCADVGALSWFEFIDFRRDIVVSSPFSRHQFLQKAAPKITLRCFHQAGHQIFWHSVESSVLIDFGVERISEAIFWDAVDENANHPAV